jgi:hypothetical protein
VNVPYEVVPKALLREMPAEWQERFAECLDELIKAFPGWDGSYLAVQKIDPATFRPEADPLAAYEPDRDAIERMRRA